MHLLEGHRKQSAAEPSMRTACFQGATLAAEAATAVQFCNFGKQPPSLFQGGQVLIAGGGSFGPSEVFISVTSCAPRARSAALQFAVCKQKDSMKKMIASLALAGRC